MVTTTRGDVARAVWTGSLRLAHAGRGAVQRVVGVGGEDVRGIGVPGGRPDGVRTGDVAAGVVGARPRGPRPLGSRPLGSRPRRPLLLRPEAPLRGSRPGGRGSAVGVPRETGRVAGVVGGLAARGGKTKKGGPGLGEPLPL